MYQIVIRDNASVIEVRNELDVLTNAMLASAIAIAEAAYERSIVVSLEHCSFCDSTGLGILANAKKRLGARFLLVVPESNQVRRLLAVTGLGKLLSPCASLDEALQLSLALAGTAPT